MWTTDSLLKAIYGSNSEAARALEVGRSALSNWKKTGHFPEYIVGRLLRAAPAKLKLKADQIPTATNRPKEAAA